MKRIGLYVGQLYFPTEKMHKWDEENLNKGGIGGSEVWAIEIASRLEKKGYHVQLFADCSERHYSIEGVEYIPYEDFAKNNQAYTFDFFITSRRTDILALDINCEHIFLYLHDPFVLYCTSEQELHAEKIKGIFYQSEYQKKEIQWRYESLRDKPFYKALQATDTSLYERVNVNGKRNKMLWSSHKIRGARILIEKIFPLIKKEIPDFEIDVCGYVDDISDDYFNVDGINVLGNITKEELVRLQKESKIWIYPNYGLFENGEINNETFCITAVENAMAKNALILANKTCFTSTLSGYEGFIGTSLFDPYNNILDSQLLEDFSKQLAEQAIALLKDEQKRQYLANNAFDICKKYTWENAVKSIINAFNEEANETTKKEELVLLTAVIRVENLDRIFKSITDNYSTGINITWVIIKDENNCKGDFSHIINQCKEYQLQNKGFSWLFYPVTSSGTRNYGGTLFNEPLKWVKNNWQKEECPWVYILDDDNTLCPLMMENIFKDMQEAKGREKTVIYYNQLEEKGVLAPKDEFVNRLIVKGTDFAPYYTLTDPSQVVISYLALEEMGFYKEGYYYDLCIDKWIEKNPNKVLYVTDCLLNGYKTTHNSITSDSTIQKWQKIISDKSKTIDATFMLAKNNEPPHVFHIDRQIAEEIFNKYIVRK